MTPAAWYAAGMPRMDAAAIEAFLTQHFPAAVDFCRIEAIRDDELDCVVDYKDAYLRPGGTISGPTLMTLADTAMYFLLLSRLGPVALAVTTSLNINFLRRPPPAGVRATARLLKLGQRLAVGEIHLRSQADEALVAQASATYALPPPPAAEG